MKKISSYLLFILALLLWPFLLEAKPFEIRLATVAPEGSAFIIEMRRMSSELKEKTAGEVVLKLYDSARMGDEIDVLRKMKSGLLHAGGFTGIGLGHIESNIRVMEVPFLFESAVEADYVYAQMQPLFKDGFKKKNMILLAGSPITDVYLFSKKDMSSNKQWSGLKMWAWEGDALAENFYTGTGINVVPLPITEVLTGLNTGLIDGVYAAPIGVVGLQWWTKLSHMSTPSFVRIISGYVMTQKAWDKVPAAHHKVVAEIFIESQKKIQVLSREDNEKAVATLLNNNIKKSPLEEESYKIFKKRSYELQDELAGKVYSAEILKKVRKHSQEYRQSIAKKNQ